MQAVEKALGSQKIVDRMHAELDSASEARRQSVLDRWTGIAERILAAEERGRELAAYDARGEELPGEWIDRTEWVLEEAARIRARQQSQS